MTELVVAAVIVLLIALMFGAAFVLVLGLESAGRRYRRYREGK